MTDPLGDMLTRIRNGQQARKDSGEHITQGIGHRHSLMPYQLDLVSPGIRPLLPISRSMIRDRRNLR